MKSWKLLNFELSHADGKKEYHIPRGLTMAYGTLISLAIGAFINDFFQLHMNIILMILLCLLFSGIVMLFDQNKHRILLYFILAGIIVAGGVISMIFRISFVEIIGKIYNWCMSYDRDTANYIKWCGLTVITGILLLCCIITYILHRKKTVKYVFASILPVMLLVSCINNVTIPKITVVVVILYALTILVEVCGKALYKSNNSVDNSIASIYLAPVCVIIALLTVVLPSHPEPIKWTGVKNMLNRVQEQGSIWMTEINYLFDQSQSEFSVNYSGYSENNDDSLGGSIRINKKNTLLISSTNKSTSRGYLLGAISDTYTGHSWESSNISKDYKTEDYTLDFYELLLAVAREQETGSDISNIVKKRSFNIYFKDIKTKSLFYPLKSYKINFTKEIKKSETPQGAFLFNKAKGNGLKYEVLYYELNLNSSELQAMLRNSQKSDSFISRKTLIQVAKDIFDVNLTSFERDYDVIKKELAIRENTIYTKYTSLPDTLPERVKTLAYELTKNYDNDYDKLKAIEAYLNTLKYSIVIERTPKGEDFVDYFLFNQQKGYCTYFASAMSILARCVGIPTRYVEGFVVDYKNKADQYTYKVLSNNAHSWVDAYIEGFGWIPFEPTPSFYGGRYIPWQELSAPRDTSVQYEPEVNIPGYYQDLINEVNTQNTNSSIQKVKKPSHAFEFVVIIICLLVIIISIVLGYYGVLVRSYNKKFTKATNNKKLTLLLTKILKYLNQEGYQLSKEDTIYTYAMRIGENVVYNDINFLYVSKIFMKVRYGEKVARDEELQAVIQFSKGLENHLLEKLGKRKMFFNRFVFLHFNQ